MNKSIFKSKVVWMGVIEIVIGVLAWINGQLEVGGIITGKGVLDIVLRLVTTKAVNLVEKK